MPLQAGSPSQGEMICRGTFHERVFLSKSHFMSTWELFWPSRSRGAHVLRAPGLKWQLKMNEAEKALTRAKQKNNIPGDAEGT